MFGGRVGEVSGKVLGTYLGGCSGNDGRYFAECWKVFGDEKNLLGNIDEPIMKTY